MSLYGEGNREGAASLINNWLQVNSEHPDYLVMAEYYLSFQKSVDDIVEAIDSLIDSRPDLEAKLLFRAAETMELKGDYPLSLDYYLMASRKTENISEQTASVLNAAGLSLLMGEISEGQKLLEKLLPQCESGEEKARALLLLSRVLYYQNRISESLQALSDSLLEEVTPEALYWKDYVNQGKKESSGLPDQFPESLSLQLQRGEVFEKTEPLYLGLTAPEDSEPETPLLPPLENDGKAVPPSVESGAIQTGSFVEEENARELQKDLERLGYQTEIRISSRNSRTYHQVLIVGIEKTLLREELTKLRERGFDGFITQ